MSQSALTSLEMRKVPLACSVFNLIEDLRAYLVAGSTKASFGRETDCLLARLPAEEKRKKVKSFNEVFRLSLQKLEAHLECHPANSYYKAARIFDPHKLPIVSHDITDYCEITAFQNPSPALLEEFLILIKECTCMLNWKNGFQRLHPKKDIVLPRWRLARTLTSHAHSLTSRARSITHYLRVLFCSCSFRLSRSTALQVMASTLDRAQLLDYTRAGVRRYLKSATDTCVEGSTTTMKSRTLAVEIS